MRTLLTEAHRRGLWQVLGIFVGGGWGVLQVVDLFIERGFVPEWVFGGALLALVMGLPVVLTTAFVQGGRKPVPGGDGASDTEAEGPDFLDLFTWNRAVLGGVLAFALLGVAATGFMVMRVTGIGAPGTLAAQGVFEVGSRVVLADFESSAGDAASSDLVTEALRIDLEQSEALRLVTNREVAETLERMLRDPSEPLSEGIAQEVAVRTGAPAVIGGEIGRIGSGFVLTARVVEAGSGNPLASFRVTADGEDELIEAIDELSSRVRSKVGESLRSVAESEPLSRVTTTSLEALRKHTAAVRGTQRGGGITPATAQQLLIDAVRMDSTFAAAHRSLSILIRNYGGDRELAQTASEAAFRHRERLPERERLIIEASYYTFVRGEERPAIEAYRSLLALDSTDTSAAGNLADALMYAGEYEEAVRVLRRTPSWESQPYTWNLTVTLVALGRLDEAMAVRDTAESVKPDEPYFPMTRALALAMGGDLERARTALSPSLTSDAGVPTWKNWVRTIILVQAGSLNEAGRSFETVDEVYERHATPSDRLHVGLAQPWVTAWVGGDLERASAQLAEHLRRLDLPSLSPFNRNYPEIALTYAMLGDQAGARDALERYRTEAASVADPVSRSRAGIAEALIQVQDGGAAQLSRLESAVDYDRCARCRDFYLGHGYELVGARQEAIEAYERYLAFSFYDGDGYVTQMFTPVVHERLARLLEEEGTAAQAALHYRRFAELWADADPDLQPRVQHAIDRAAALESLDGN